jgi:hypothetical protein
MRFLSTVVLSALSLSASVLALPTATINSDGNFLPDGYIKARSDDGNFLPDGYIKARSEDGNFLPDGYIKA